WCRGWYVDRARRLARVYHCGTSRERDHELECELLVNEAWAEWDIGVAWEKQFEVGALAGMALEPDGHAAALDAWTGCTAARLLTCHPDPERFRFRWDPAAERLEHDWYDHGGVDVSVIDPSGGVRTYGFDRDDVLFELLGRGPAVLDELRRAPPCPGMSSRDTESGAVIDQRLREIGFRLEDAVSPTTIDELRRRWPGWVIERERAGISGHYQWLGDDVRAGELHYIEAVHVEPAALPAPQIPDDEAALLREIHADLDADLPRQVYADLLLSKGDPRGALVNVQIALARGDEPDRREALREEERFLLRRYGVDRVPGGEVTRFERGFPLVARTWGAAAAELAMLERAPTLQELHVHDADADDLARLFAAPGFERIRALELRPKPGALARLFGGPACATLQRLAIIADTPELAEELLAAIAAPGASATPGWPALASVRELSLVRTDLRNGGAARLAATPAIAQLRALALTACRLGSDGMAALAASRHLAALTSLQIIAPSQDDPDGLRALRARFGEALSIDGA
ncbi:MAG: TIGR02996 domain-containing protein, partial [Kofleriaceae bacterium]